MAEERKDEARGDSDVKHDRRRPGRVAYGNPNLIRLLRRSFDTMPQQEAEDGLEAAPASPAAEEARITDSTDDLGPSRGIAFGVALVAPLWVLIGAVVWLLWKGVP